MISLDLPEAKKFKKSMTKLYIITTLCACQIYNIKQSRQNRYYFKLLLGKCTNRSKWGIKRKLLTSRTLSWGRFSVKSWNESRQRPFMTQKMTKMAKNSNIAVRYFFCQMAAKGVVNCTKKWEISLLVLKLSSGTAKRKQQEIDDD